MKQIQDFEELQSNFVPFWGYSTKIFMLQCTIDLRNSSLTPNFSDYLII